MLKAAQAKTVPTCPTSAIELVEKTKSMNPIEKEKAAADYYSLGCKFEIGKLVPLWGTGAKVARFYFEASANLGYLEAQNKIGVYYSKGRGGLSINEEKALDAYKEAGKNGSARARRNIAIYHAQGLGGLHQDTDIAFMLLSEVRLQTKNSISKFHIWHRW